MIEIPEARTIAKQLREEIVGKKIVTVGGNFTDHKFTFYEGNPTLYASYLVGKQVSEIVDRNYYVEIVIQAYFLIMRDGANIRYGDVNAKQPVKSKLLLTFEDGSYLTVTTSMYCFIGVFSTTEECPNDYYKLEKTRIGVLDTAFTLPYFKQLMMGENEKLSLKALLATEQRILGIGNGVIQDVLWQAKLHPKKKVSSLTEQEKEILYHALVTTVEKMVELGGRDTEKDIYGQKGGYPTILSSLTYQKGCPICHEAIHKEAYLGGSIYYCSHCQKQ